MSWSNYYSASCRLGCLLVVAAMLVGLGVGGCAGRRGTPEPRHGAESAPDGALERDGPADVALDDTGTRDLAAGLDDYDPPAGDPAALEDLVAAIDAVGADPDKGFALLFGNAALHSRPDDDARLGRLAVFAEGERVAPDAVVYLVRVVGTAGDGFVEIETLGVDELKGHCFPGSDEALERYRIRAHVKRADLAPATCGPFMRRYADGTAVGLAAGLPARPTVEGLLVRLLPFGVEIPLELAGQVAEVFGRVHEVTEPVGAVEPLDVRLSHEVTWYLGEERFTAAGYLFRHADVLSLMPHPDGESGTLATIGNHCWTLTLRTDDEAATTVATVYEAADTVHGERGPKLEAGTEAFWPDGTPAGKTRERFVLVDRPTALDGLSCVPLLGEVRICHRAEDIDLEER